MARNNNSSSRTSNRKVLKTPRETKRKKRIIKLVLFFLFISLIIAGIYLLLKHPTFNIRSFKLEGTEKYTIDDITNQLKLQTGKNIFTQTLKCDKKNISTLPYVERIKFKYNLPDELGIQIIERKSKYFAFDKEKNKYYKLDKDGYILEESTVDKKSEDELLLQGITFDNEVISGDKINDIDMSKILIFLEINNEFEKSKINRKITKVNFENSLTTLTLNDKLNVIFPNKDNLSYKMVMLGEILKSIGEDSGGVLDLTQTNPTYSSF